MRKFGLIGYKLTHSFSKKYFTEKFDREGLADCRFDLYELDEIEHLKKVLAENRELEGLSVTIPYKEKVIALLDELDLACENIGAVNCIKFNCGKLKGYNTDYMGFKISLEKWLGAQRPKALVLGTGGASKAVIQALKDLEIEYLIVSRTPSDVERMITYQDLKVDDSILKSHYLIINTTPLGTFPETEVMPDMDINKITDQHKIYDLVYNPEKTFLMRSMEAQGAEVKNGLEMLHLQAEAAWKIWN